MLNGQLRECACDSLLNRCERRLREREGEWLVTTSLVIGALFVLLYLPAIGYVYGRQRRWFGAAGWAVLMAGVLLVLGGAGDAFAWAALLWLFVAGAGLIMIAIDVAETRR